MNPHPHPCHRSRAVAVLVLTATIGYALHRLGRGQLATPPIDDPTALGAWTAERGTLAASMATLRLVAMAAAAYVAVVATALLAASCTTMPRSITRVALLATPRVLRGTLGLGVATAVLLPSTVATAAPGADTADPANPPPVLVWVDGVAGAEPAVPADTSTPPPAASTPPPATPAPEPTDAATAGDVWEVRPGDHFWAIAEAVVHAHHPGATERDVARYWRVLVDANRDRLVAPENADLVLPGQQFVLPPVG